MADEKKITIKNDSLILAKPGITLQEEADNWGILHNPDTDFSFGINPVSVFIWKQLKSKHTIKQLVNKVRENCANVPDEVEADVIFFVEKLLGKGLATQETA